MRSPSDTTDYALTGTLVMCPDLGNAKPQAVGMGFNSVSEFPVGPHLRLRSASPCQCWDIAIEGYLTFGLTNESHDLGTKVSRAV